MRVQIKSIICMTDLSDLSNHAVFYGIAMARELGAKLYVCHVVDISSAAMYEVAVSYSLEQENRMVNYAYENLEELVGEVPVDYEAVVSVGHAATEIARIVEEKGVGLAVAASHGRSGLKRLILGSVTERLMRTLPCPLLVVRGHERGFLTSGDQDLRLKRILVGCDFSPDSSLAFEYGLSLAQEFESELHLAHVIAPPVYKDLLKPAKEKGDEGRRDLRDLLREELTNMVPEDARAWCIPKTALLGGQPHEELTKYALVNDVDLIVLGVMGHGLVEKLFVGSTTVRVVCRASCPVLSVRPMGEGYQED
jgi:nucleotide-binding universal stress UspA family protein